MDGIADYEFVRPLGAGNHGEYYLARKPARLPVDAEMVAVKVLSGAASEDVFRRATRELSAFAAVRSEYLVSLFDAGQQGGVFYYSMEYLPDGSLANPAYLLDPARTLTAVAHAARAAHALHEAGIVHRDIKPGNVLLHAKGAKLSDLGLSQVLTPGMTLTGMGELASIEFVDPALLHGDPPSRASDIFSLGVTLHSVMAGHGLYGELPDRDPVLALRKVLSTPPTVDPGLDEEVAQIIRACIAADRPLRPPTALDLAERIEALVA
ncbi:MAG TPA: serine/threonine-protein kinase [Cryptosporangiaceae bacterium]|nr:serine/threonine-protein kinase [Cryptosporangiaceae bacterium]